MKKRNLDGIYLIVRRGGKNEPVCLSDMTEDELSRKLDDIPFNEANMKWLKGAVKHLAHCLRELGEYTNYSKEY